ncbi:MAG: MerR family transcriptional regulator [Desulfobacca sp.]|uniref:MerR family transcriptional regulator n=1 Tax=Desulfobacca sp. TaxID=2067990 RepID=UPI00404AEBD3
MVGDVLGEELLLNIDQVSRLTGVRKSTLRYWEKSFAEFLKPVRTESNRREYRLADVEVIQTIKRLLEEEHLTNVGVRLKLREILGAKGQ